jgi:hypothetical protein
LPLNDCPTNIRPWRTTTISYSCVVCTGNSIPRAECSCAPSTMQRSSGMADCRHAGDSTV